MLFAVKLELFKVIEFNPSIQTPSERFEVNVEFDTVISAVE